MSQRFLFACGEGFGGPPGQLVDCYDQNGAVLPSRAADLRGFVNPTLAVAAMRQGPAFATIDTGDPQYGHVRVLYRALFAPDGSVVGAIEVGQSVEGELSTLHTLLVLLLGIGCLTLVLASFGGLFLANRALLPARLAYKRQRDFIADASHELRTPLTMLRADAEVLLRGRGHLQADDVALLEDVVAEAAHMANLADTMLNLARLDAQGAQIEQDVVDLAGLAAEVGRRVGPLAAERGVSVEVEAEPAVLVVGDRVMLEQAVLVLVDNAIKYNRPGGQVLVRVSAEGNRANLAVKDTGIGIASEHLPHLGERFYRVDKARSREAGGAGLGVSIAQSIASRHRGSLQYESEAGEGTTATLSLPLARAVRREDAVPEVASG
ncbi:MAG: hypothetical protein JOZ41_20065 [Chloroflexi bacterium]|nr:hypothetical protein [Chloroflexota bacterium]